MSKKNIISNISLESYNKKYRNRKYRLVKYTKKEVEDFDKKYPSDITNRLLYGRKWAYINGTYYEIPRPIRFSWFRNLHAGVQVGTCVLAAGIVASAIAVPLVMINANKQELIIDKEVQEYVNIDYKGTTPDGGKIYELTPVSADTEITGIESVYIGEDKLIVDEEYTVTVHNSNAVELIIKKVAFEKHKGAIKIKPSVDFPWREKEITHEEFTSIFTNWKNYYSNNNYDYSIQSIPNIYILTGNSDESTKYATTGVFNRKDGGEYNKKETYLEYNGVYKTIDINQINNVASLTNGKHYGCKKQISYVNADAEGTETKSLKINNYGIVVENIDGNGDGFKLDVVGEPSSISITSIVVKDENGDEVSDINMPKTQTKKLYVYNQDGVNVTNRCANNYGNFKLTREDNHFIFTSKGSAGGGTMVISHTNPYTQKTISFTFTN